MPRFGGESGDMAWRTRPVRYSAEPGRKDNEWSATLLIARTATIAAAASAIAVCLAAPAGADSDGVSCPLVLTPVCSAVPMLPDLDHDVDLTKDPNALTGDAGGQPTPPDSSGR
jgi:hypothetical protein